VDASRSCDTSPGAGVNGSPRALIAATVPEDFYIPPMEKVLRQRYVTILINEILEMNQVLISSLPGEPSRYPPGPHGYSHPPKLRTVFRRISEGNAP